MEVVALRPIKAGEQWLAEYGDEYRFSLRKKQVQANAFLTTLEQSEPEKDPKHHKRRKSDREARNLQANKLC